MRRGCPRSVTLEVDVDTQRPDFLDEHVERFRHSRFDLVITLDDVFVHLGTAGNVIGLHREHFLQYVRCTVSFQRPDFHFTEALTTELRLTTQRLLRDQGVRAGRTGVHLVVDQVV